MVTVDAREADKIEIGAELALYYTLLAMCGLGAHGANLYMALVSQACMWRFDRRSLGGFAVLASGGAGCMVWRFLNFNKRAPPALPAARFVEGRVAFAVGDLHGRADLLAIMLDTLDREIAAAPRDGGDPVVVFLGDYVDRGTESPRVIDLLLNWAPAGCERRYLRGNHDQSMLAFLDAPAANRAWLMHGGMETLASYGVEPPWPRAPDADLESAAETLRTNLPPAHLEFLSGLERYVAYGDYLFVHAGVDPGKPLAEQTDDDLFRIRERFTNSRKPFSHRVVHGHTVTDAPVIDERRVSIDTGAFASGRLTAARFEGEAVSFLFAP